MYPFIIFSIFYFAFFNDSLNGRILVQSKEAFSVYKCVLCIAAIYARFKSFLT